MMRKYLAEIISTFALVFCGTGAIIINQETNGVVTHVGVAITFGLTVASMIYTFGPVSGAHMNPAVTIALWLAREFEAKNIAPFIAAQSIGAFLASVTLHFLFPGNQLLGSTLPSGTESQSFILELVLTFFLMLVILGFVKGNANKSMAGLIIGCVVLLEALFAGPVCGASMNPIRSIAPAIVSGHTEHLWIYLTATTMGAVLAVYTYKLVSFDSGKN